MNKGRAVERARSGQERQAGLERIELFSGLPLEAVRELEGLAKWHDFAPEEPVFDKNSETLEVYFVVSGVIRILAYVEGEREVALADVGAGNYFGELAAIDGLKRSARAVAVQDSLLASVEGRDFTAFMVKYPQVALRVLERFARIIRNLDNRVTDLSTQTEGQRIYVELVKLAQPDPRRPHFWHIPDMPNHREIAAWAGVSREAVAKAIGELARAQIIERRNLHFVIHDWGKLQLLAKGGANV